MKLNTLQLFLVLLVGLLACSLLSNNSVMEGLEPRNNKDTTATKNFNPFTPQTALNRVRDSANKPPQVQDARGEDPPQATIRGSEYGGTLGVPRSQIPSGDEDLYILKSEIVPPVCPACPSSAVCPRQEPCPACPPCARCPESAFECKKVPNYRNNDDMYIPRPVLADFSQFGM